MNEQEAREIVELYKHLEKAINDPFLHTSMEKAVHQYLEAKGFLAGLEAERVKSLLESAMTEAKAREIASAKDIDTNEYYIAKGYLQGVEKFKPVVEALKLAKEEIQLRGKCTCDSDSVCEYSEILARIDRDLFAYKRDVLGEP